MSPAESDSDEIDVLLALSESAVLTQTDDDFALTDIFRSDWWRRIDQVTDDPTRYLGLLLDADPESLSVAEVSDGVTVQDTSRTATHEVGEWPSEAAMVADIAAFISLDEWLPEFEELDDIGRDELVAWLRIFLAACPSCGSTLEHAPGDSKDAIPSVQCEEFGSEVL